MGSAIEMTAFASVLPVIQETLAREQRAPMIAAGMASVATCRNSTWPPQLATMRGMPLESKCASVMRATRVPTVPNANALAGMIHRLCVTSRIPW